MGHAVSRSRQRAQRCSTCPASTAARPCTSTSRTPRCAVSARRRLRRRLLVLSCELRAAHGRSRSRTATARIELEFDVDTRGGRENSLAQARHAGRSRSASSARRSSRSSSRTTSASERSSRSVRDRQTGRPTLRPPAGVAQRRRTGLRSRRAQPMRVRFPPSASRALVAQRQSQRARSADGGSHCCEGFDGLRPAPSASVAQRKSTGLRTPGAEVRLLSGALTRHRGRAARRAPAKRATAVRVRPVSLTQRQ